MMSNLESALSVMVTRDLAWTQQCRRGRWMVVEPGPSLYLRELSPNVRAAVDARAKLRGRRFSSLSRARAFARLVGGHVERRGRRTWHNVSPWARVAATADLGALNLARLAMRAHLEGVP